MKKITAIISTLVTITVFSACSDNKGRENSSTTVTTTTPTTATTTTTAIETEEIKEDNIFDHFKSKGTVIYEGSGDENSDLYTLIVEEEPDHVELYFILPENSVERNIYMLTGTIEPYLDMLSDRTFVGFMWFDHEENYIANFSVVKLSGEWGSPMGLTWYDEEYENTYNTLLEQSEQ